MSDSLLILCTTCGTRLRVRDPAALGQIMPCPKCGGMVKVEPQVNQEASKAVSRAASGANAVGRPLGKPLVSDAFDDIDDILNGIPTAKAKAESPSPSTMATPDHREVAKREARPKNATATGLDTRARRVPESHPEPPPVIAPPPMAESAPEPPPITLPKQVAPPEDTTPEVASMAEEEFIAPDIESLSQASEATSNIPAPEAEPSLAVQSPPELPPEDHPANELSTTEQDSAAEAGMPPPGIAFAASPRMQQWRQWVLTISAGVLGLVFAGLLFRWMIGGANGATVPVATNPSTNSTSPNPAAANSTDVPATPTDPESSTASAPIEPATSPSDSPNTPTTAENDPTSTSPLVAQSTPVSKPDSELKPTPKPDSQPEPKATLKPDTEPVAALRPSIDPVVRMLDQFAPFLDDNERRTNTAPAAIATPAASEQREPTRSRPLPPQVDVTAQLQLPVAQIEFPDTRLVDFTQFVSDLTTIPITIDPEALLRSRVAADTAVKVQLKRATVADILTESLKPLRLSYVAADGHLLVTRIAVQPPRPVTFDIADLAADTAQATEIANWLRQLIEPESWSTSGGSGTITVRDRALVVEQPEATTFRVLSALEKLRIARRLPKKSPFPAELFQTDSRTYRARNKLATPITVNYLRPTLLVQILDRLGRTADMRILCDWTAIYEANWSCRAETTLTVREQPLRETLTQLLRPMDLAFRVLDEGTLQVTTPQAIAAQYDLECFPLSDPVTQTESIRQAVGVQQFRDGGGQGVLLLDPKSRFVFVVCPQPQQVVIEELLRPIGNGAAQAAR